MRRENLVHFMDALRTYPAASAYQPRSFVIPSSSFKIDGSSIWAFYPASFFRIVQLPGVRVYNNLLAWRAWSDLLYKGRNIFRRCAIHPYRNYLLTTFKKRSALFYRSTIADPLAIPARKTYPCKFILRQMFDKAPQTFCFLKTRNRFTRQKIDRWIW